MLNHFADGNVEGFELFGAPFAEIGRVFFGDVVGGADVGSVVGEYASLDDCLVGTES